MIRFFLGLIYVNETILQWQSQGGGLWGWNPYPFPDKFSQLLGKIEKKYAENRLQPPPPFCVQKPLPFEKILHSYFSYDKIKQ